MKRSRHRWLSVSIFCIVLTVLASDLPITSAARATSLIFAKTTTTTTAAPEEVPESEDGPQTEATAEDGEASNSTNKRTGIPQIDYIHDPNLPRELNGYNLSEYPFYEAVPPPETMDFKCDGLHDGFYASVPHKCQVYHHCLYGTRYDFLCANYTAFDQKTFICHFVSEVDCKNSPNYFSRNEALYKSASTDPPPPPPTTTTTTTTTQRPTRPPRRRPHYRYDYYDDDYYYRDDYDYDDRRRPRPRPGGRPGKKNRPVDDYEDDRYDRRPRPRDQEPVDEFEERRPYDRRPGKRRPYEEEDDRRPGFRPGRRPRPRDEEDDRYPPDDRYSPDDEDRPRGGKRDDTRDDVRPKRPRDETRPRDEFRPRDEEPIRPKDETRTRDDERPRDEIRPRDEKRPRDEARSKEDSRPRDEIRPRDEVKPRDEIRSRDSIRSRDEIRPRDERRPPRDEVLEKPSRPREDRYQNEGRRYREDRPYRNRDERPNVKPERNYENDDRVQEDKKDTPSAPEGLVKPNGHGLFSQPRMPPKVKRPVPLSERGKYEYQSAATPKVPPKVGEDEYYDYEEDDTSKPLPSAKAAAVQQRPKAEPVEKEKFRPTRPLITGPGGKGRKTKRPIDYEDEYYNPPPTGRGQKYSYNQRNKEERTPKPNDDYYYDDEDKKDQKERIVREEVEEKVKQVRPTVKVVKRPFLPSRGGSPYLPRGLQPVAGRDLTAPLNTTPKPTTTSTTTTTTTKPTTTSRTTTTRTTTTRPTTTRTTTTPTPTTTTSTTTTVKAEKPTTSQQLRQGIEDEYEYYDEEDIDYDRTKKESTTAAAHTTIKVESTQQPETTTAQLITHEQKAKQLASKVLRVYNDNYEAIRDKLESTLSPGDYIKPYLATSIPFTNEDSYKPKIKVEVSKPYGPTGKPVIPENISIKQNLADSVENDFDDRFNEALSPNLPINRVPSGFVSADRDYTFARFRGNFQNAEPQYSASEVSAYQVRKRPHVNIRTPSSYYLQPQRLVYQDDVLTRFPRTLYRQFLGDF